MKKRLITALALTGGVTIVLLANEGDSCFAPTNPDCPTSVHVKGMSCGIDITSNTSYDFVGLSSSGQNSAYSGADGCTYLCPDDEVESFYPQAYPTGGSCP